MIDHCLLSQSVIRPASHQDVGLVDALQRQFSEQVGFLRLSDLHYLQARGTVAVLAAEGQTVGALVWSGGQRRPACLRQIMIPEDLWAMGLGGASMSWWLGRCLDGEWSYARCRTRCDLDRQMAINQRLGGRLSLKLPAGRRADWVGDWSFQRNAAMVLRSDDLLLHGMAVEELRVASVCCSAGDAYGHLRERECDPGASRTLPPAERC